MRKPAWPSLKTHDGTRTVRLADLLGEGKPVVLTFGNFTCGPFRYMFPGVEAVHTRFADEATFVAVYVREAHPTDGWKMETNEKAGVAVAQDARRHAHRAAGRPARRGQAGRADVRQLHLRAVPLHVPRRRGRAHAVRRRGDVRRGVRARGAPDGRVEDGDQ